MRPIAIGRVAIVALVYVQCDRVLAGGLVHAGSALAERSAAALLARTLSSFARATRRGQESNKNQEYREDFTARAHQLLDNSAPPVMTASASNQQAIKAITSSLTPNRGEGSRFSYSTAWGALPECAAQQVCSALYVRLNRTQPLCQCSSGQFKEPCSTTDYVDEHSIKLISSNDKKKAYNLVKVCEPVMSIRRCKSPQDWQLLALQSTRTGKSHYLVVCRCPTGSSLLGPIKHSNPPYANIPGIRVYGMLCSQRRGNRQLKEKELPPVPWDRVLHLARQSGLTNITLPFS